MTPEERVRMNELCMQIQNEKDYHKFEELIAEVNALMAAKERRFPQNKVAPPGTVQKMLHATAIRTLPPLSHGKAETVEIRVADAEPLYAEIRVENTFTDERGNVVALSTPARLDVALYAPGQGNGKAASAPSKASS